jgi:hypothetical protein
MLESPLSRYELRLLRKQYPLLDFVQDQTPHGTFLYYRLSRRLVERSITAKLTSYLAEAKSKMRALAKNTTLGR